MVKDCFISYAREDREKVELFAKALTNHGVRVWWDTNIKTGAGFRAEISEALAQAKAVVVFWSRNSVTSRFVCDEADDGAARGILFPALIDSVDIPLGFRQIQTADLTRWRGRLDDPALRRFVETIAHHAGRAPAEAAPAPAPAPHPKPEADTPAPATKPAKKEKPKPAPKPRAEKPPAEQAVPAGRYTTTGAKQRAGLFFRSLVLTLIAAGGFGAIAYGSQFVFEAFRPAFIAALAGLAFLSRFATFQADRATGAASTHLFARSYLSLIFFSMILLAPIILEGRMYAAALQGVQVRGIEGADINGVALDATGKKLLTSSDDGTVRVWDVATGVERGEYRGHTNWVWSAAFSPDGTKAASASRDLTAQVWTTGVVAPLMTLEGHRNSLYDIDWSPDGSAIATASGDGSAIIWDAGTGEQLRSLDGHGGGATSLDFSPDGDRLVVSSEDGMVRLWDWRTGRGLGSAGAGGGKIEDVRFSHDGDLIGAAVDGGRVRIWSAGALDRVRDLDHGARAFALAFVDGDRAVATTGIDGVIRFWSLDDGALRTEVAAHKDGARGLDSTPDGSVLVSGSRDNTARVWDVASGRELQTMGHVKAALRLPVAIDAPPHLAASRAPVPVDFRANPEAAAMLLAKGAALALALTLAALLVKGFLWLVRLRPVARSVLTLVLLGASVYAGVLMLSALPLEALWLWLTLAFAPAALIALARWAVAALLGGRRTASRRG